jgi:hypothetical protein
MKIHDKYLNLDDILAGEKRLSCRVDGTIPARKWPVSICGPHPGRVDMFDTSANANDTTDAADASVSSQRTNAEQSSSFNSSTITTATQIANRSLTDGNAGVLSCVRTCM